MLGFFLGKKGKFKLKEKMQVELEFLTPSGVKNYFTEVLEVSSKKSTFATPKEGNKFVSVDINDIIKCITLIDNTIFEVNIKVTSALDREFEALISKNLQSFDTILSNLKKPEELNIEAEIPLDFRAITTSHLQRAVTKTITREAIEMVTNLPVPEGTDLKIIFRVPDSPSIETEGKSEKSVPLEEDTKKSKTRIIFSEKAKETEMIDDLTVYILHYLRRVERHKEMEEKGEIPKKEEEAPPPTKRASVKKS